MRKDKSLHIVSDTNSSKSKIDFASRFIVFGVLCQMLLHRFDEEAPSRARKQLIKRIEKEAELFVDRIVLPLFINRDAMVEVFVNTTIEFEEYFTGVTTDYVAAVMRELSNDIKGFQALRNLLKQVSGTYDAHEVRQDTLEFMEAIAPKMFDVEIR
jgi:hypothetical protein